MQNQERKKKRGGGGKKKPGKVVFSCSLTVRYKDSSSSSGNLYLWVVRRYIQHKLLTADLWCVDVTLSQLQSLFRERGAGF